MNKIKKILVVILAVMVMTFSFAACGSSTSSSTSSASSKTTSSSSDASDTTVKGLVTVDYSSRDQDASYDESSATKVTLSDESYTITKEGTYIFTGTLKDGQIIVDAADTAKVQIVLNGVTVTSSDGPAIYVKSADKVFLTLADGTTNTISDSSSYASTYTSANQPWAAIFSKCDLTINGSGSLVVNGNYQNGIVSKDDLKICGGTIKVTAVKNGIKGTDSVGILKGTITVNAKHDGIKSSNTKDGKGYVSINGGKVTITGVSSQGVQASNVFQITAGTLKITSSNEGVQAAQLLVAGGTTTITSSDDGLNATNGTSSSQGMMDSAQDGVYIKITGGKLNISAQGDGVDSNGDLYVSGGTTIVQGPENDGNGPIDYQGSSKITGGTFIAIGSSGMAQNFGDNSTQASLLYNGSSYSSGTTVTLTDSDGNKIASVKSTVKFASVLISTPKMAKGTTYTLKLGSDSESCKMSSLVTTIGSTGMGGGGMGGGQMGGGGPGGSGGFSGGGKPGSQSN